MIDVEESLRNLWSPQWPAEFPPIVEDKRAKGELLYKQYCVECHQPIKRDDKNRTVKAWLERSVGTDPAMARNFLTRTAKTGAFQDQKISVLGIRRFGSDAPVAELLTHTVERVLLGGGTSRATPSFSPYNLAAPIEVNLDGKMMVGRFQSLKLDQGKFLAGIGPEEQRIRDLVIRKGGKVFKIDASKFSAGRFLPADGSAPLTIDTWSPNSISSTEGSVVALKSAAPLNYIYKGRPLNGIWATAPYLHNGSVPNLDELLKKPEKRVTKFFVGSREFVPENVGFRIDAGTFQFDTAQPGNSNGGHDYDIEFSPDQRSQLIEYMKSL